MDATIATVGHIVKRTYPDERSIFNAAQRKRVLFNKMKRRKLAIGEVYQPPIEFGNPQGITNDYTVLATNETPSKGLKWSIDYAEKHGRVTISSRLIHQSAGNMAAFVDAVQHEYDNKLDEFGKRLNIELCGDGTGTIGVVSAFATDKITLTRQADVRNFAPQQVVQLGDPASGTARAGTLTVLNLLPDTNQVQFTGNVTAGVALAANGDLIVNNGDYKNGAKGVLAWIPETLEAGTFFGQSRAPDRTSLAGHFLPATGAAIEDQIITLGAMIYSAGGSPDAAFIAPLNWADLAKSRHALVEVDQGSDPTVGFQYIRLMTPSGSVKLYPDPGITTDHLFMLQMDTWEVIYAGPGFPHFNKDDGLLARKGTGDNIQSWTRAYWQVVCKAPSKNGVCRLK